MERLSDKAIEIINDLHTERLDYTSEYLPLIESAKKLAAYEDTLLEPYEVKEFLEDVESRFVLWINKRYGIPATKFMDIMQAEKDGRLVVLPCKIWDLYFTIERFCDENGELPEFTLHSASDCEWCCVPCNKRLDIIEHRFSSAKHILSLNDRIGKSVFLTREEAEAALKKRKEADDEIN